MITHKKGEMIIVMAGEYSDLRLDNLFRVLKNFNIQIQARVFNKSIPKSYRYASSAQTNRYGQPEFWEQMVEKGLLEEVEFTNFNLDDYGDFNPSQALNFRRETTS